MRHRTSCPLLKLLGQAHSPNPTHPLPSTELVLLCFPGEVEVPLSQVPWLVRGRASSLMGCRWQVAKGRGHLFLAHETTWSRSGDKANSVTPMTSGLTQSPCQQDQLYTVLPREGPGPALLSVIAGEEQSQLSLVLPALKSGTLLW